MLRHPLLCACLILVTACLRHGEYAYRDAPKAANPEGLWAVVTHVHRRSDLLIMNLELDNRSEAAVYLGEAELPHAAFLLDVAAREGLRATAVVAPETGAPLFERLRIEAGARLDLQLRWRFRPSLPSPRYLWRLHVVKVTWADGGVGGELVVTGEAPRCHCPKDKEPTLGLGREQSVP